MDRRKTKPSERDEENNSRSHNADGSKNGDMKEKHKDNQQKRKRSFEADKEDDLDN